MYLTCTLGGAEFSGFQTAMCMMALVFSGLVMLYRVCQPFNGYRLVLFVLMTALCIVAMSVPFTAKMLCENWNTLNWTYPKILIVVVAIEAAFPISSSLIKIMQIIMPSSTSSDSKKNADENKNKKKAVK